MHRSILFLLYIFAAALPVSAEFVSVTEEAFGMNHREVHGGWNCVAWPDVDNDGWPDLHNGGHYLWLNNQDGTFTYADSIGIEYPGGRSDSRVTYADVDGDGDLDLVQTSFAASSRDNIVSSYYYINELELGSLQFRRYLLYGYPPNTRGGQAIFVNGDNDPVPEIYMGTFGNWSPSYGRNYDRYFTLIFDGYWQDDTRTYFPQLASGEDYERPVRGVNHCDYDNDGDQDIFVPVYGVAFSEVWDNCLWNNDGEGNFTNVADEAGLAVEPHGRYEIGLASGACWGDYDNDGDFDIAIANIHGWLALHENLGDGTFSEARNEEAGLPTPVAGTYEEQQWHACLWIDYDNDGDLDLFGWQWYDFPAMVFRNNGPENLGTFTRVERDLGLSPFNEWRFVNVAGAADYDRDGDMDLYFCGGDTADNAEARGHHLFRNDLDEDAAQNHWLVAQLVGDSATSGRTAIGAQVRLLYPDSSWSGVRQVETATTDGAMNMHALHFGLGEHDSLAGIRVNWPDRTEQFFEWDYFEGIDRWITLVQGDSLEPDDTSGVRRNDRTSLPDVPELLPPYPNPFNAETVVSLKLPTARPVRLDVLNITGQLVRRLYNGNPGAGTHRIVFHAADLPSGIYFLRLDTGEESRIRKIVLLK